MSKEITTQAELDEWVEHLKEVRFPYLVGENVTLTAEGNIRDEWVNDDGSVEFVEQTREEFFESVYCWEHDC